MVKRNAKYDPGLVSQIQQRPRRYPELFAGRSAGGGNGTLLGSFSVELSDENLISLLQQFHAAGRQQLPESIERLPAELRRHAVVTAPVVKKFQIAVDDFELTRGRYFTSSHEARMVKDMNLLKIRSIKISLRIHDKHRELEIGLYAMFIDAYCRSGGCAIKKSCEATLTRRG